MITELIGYADRFSAAPGETVRFMVSTDLPHYDTTLVRLIHGDENPEGPGFKEEAFDSALGERQTGRKQIARSRLLRAGGAPCLPRSAAELHLAGLDLSHHACQRRCPGHPEQTVRRRQRLLPLLLAPTAASRSRLAVQERIPTPPRAPAAPSEAGEWYFVAAAFDAETQTVRLFQLPLSNWPADPSSAAIERSVNVQGPPSNSGPLLIAAAGPGGTHTGRYAASGLFNGKIDGPLIFSRGAGRRRNHAPDARDTARRGGRFRPRGRMGFRRGRIFRQCDRQRSERPARSRRPICRRAR